LKKDKLREELSKQKRLEQLEKEFEILYVCTSCGRKFHLARASVTCPCCGGVVIKKFLAKKDAIIV